MRVFGAANSDGLFNTKISQSWIKQSKNIADAVVVSHAGVGEWRSGCCRPMEVDIHVYLI